MVLRLCQALQLKSKQTWLLLVIILFLIIKTLLTQNQILKNQTASKNYKKIIPKLSSEDLGIPSSGKFSSIRKSISKSGEHKRRLPQCLIIGAKKAGTGALLHFLDFHPYIEIAKKELNFFDYQNRFEKGFEWYKSNMPLSYPAQITIEKTANYFHNRDTEWRVHSMNNSIKLILVLREPVERTISDYVQRVLRHKDLSWSSFEDTVIDVKTGDVKEEFIIMKPSYYDRHMARWLKYFNLEQFLLIDGEILVKKPYEVIYDVENFLNIPHLLTQDKFVFNKTKGFYCVLKEKGNQKCMSEIKGRKHPDVDISVRQSLKNTFKSHNELFYKMIRKKFRW